MQNRGFFQQPRGTRERPAGAATFKEFDATELYCPRCGTSMPVLKRLLLVLPEGDKFEYLCSVCATSVGSKIVRETEHTRVLI